MSLTKQQRDYAEARFNGATIKEAALLAGCPAKSASQAGSRLEKHPNVIAHLGRLKTKESDEKPEAGRDPIAPGQLDDFYEDPKDLLRQVMNNKFEDTKVRLQAAVALLPYEHKKLGESGKKESSDEAAKGAAKGRFSPARPPGANQLTLVGK